MASAAQGTSSGGPVDASAATKGSRRAGAGRLALVAAPTALLLRPVWMVGWPGSGPWSAAATGLPAHSFTIVMTVAISTLASASALLLWRRDAVALAFAVPMAALGATFAMGSLPASDLPVPVAWGTALVLVLPSVHASRRLLAGKDRQRIDADAVARVVADAWAAMLAALALALLGAG